MPKRAKSIRPPPVDSRPKNKLLACLPRADFKYTHGRIKILDGMSLEKASCECYATLKGHFDRLGL